MKLLLLAVILAVSQTSVPTPRQTTDRAASTGRHIKKQPERHDEPTTSVTSSLDTNKTPPDQNNRQPQKSDNIDQTISVSKLPTVTVATNKRDWADWGIWIFNFLLVLVGGLQVWLLLGTLRAIQRQADTMDRQFRDSTKEVVLLNRAYLTVDNWMGDRPSGLKFRIYNPSKTAARVEQIMYTINEKTSTVPYGLMLTPNESQWVQITSVEWPPISPFGDTVFKVSGRVSYRDIFKQVRHRTFSRLCGVDALEKINFFVPNDIGVNDEDEWSMDDEPSGKS